MKVIVRLKGGIGNQLFSYSAARRLALTNNCELVIDSISGFLWDHQFKRKYELDNFNISSRMATPEERFEPFSRVRRHLFKFFSSMVDYENRKYIEQNESYFDYNLLNLKLKHVVYLDGLWQSHKYFSDVENIIRSDLKIIPPTDHLNVKFSEIINSCNAIAIHIRWFDSPGMISKNNISLSYYRNAINFITEKIEAPHFFLFSDDPPAALLGLGLTEKHVTLVKHNSQAENNYADLWLMTKCRNFIISNSTFSWWGAWLAAAENKIVIFPKLDINDDGNIPWAMSGEMPNKWIAI